MHREYRKLCRWFQGNDAVAAADVEHARERIRNVREHMRSLLRRIERIERCGQICQGFEIRSDKAMGPSGGDHRVCSPDPTTRVLCTW